MCSNVLKKRRNANPETVLKGALGGDELGDASQASSGPLTTVVESVASRLISSGCRAKTITLGEGANLSLERSAFHVDKLSFHGASEVQRSKEGTVEDNLSRAIKVSPSFLPNFIILHDSLIDVE